MTATALTRVDVKLGSRSYPILIGSGLLGAASEHLSKALPNTKFAIVADEAIEQYAGTLEAGLSASGLLLGKPIFVPSGEGSKSFAELERVCGALLELGIERDHAVIALGGGVIGDLAGLAAANIKRGVALVQAPTTLLAQVDSSVGGKTGIDTPQGKNLVGAFHQPSLVLTDIDTLKTLPKREFLSGYAEVVKYGALGDAVFFRWLEQNVDAIFDFDAEALAYAIETCCQMKAEIVSRDEKESGDRALLNLGHTFGHAIEAWAGYSGGIVHGEAIAVGMELAFRFSASKGYCGTRIADRLKQHLIDVGLPADFAGVRKLTGRSPSLDELMTFMEQDKKVKDGQIALILVRGVGDAFIERNVPKAEIRAFLRAQLG
ncbi:MAG: 3-dehydroquinate synthase [Rhodomicrobium sp.]|jgi:3-dehydroquinate synthase